jgi:hypothetical protein
MRHTSIVLPKSWWSAGMPSARREAQAGRSGADDDDVEAGGIEAHGTLHSRGLYATRVSRVRD